MLPINLTYDLPRRGKIVPLAHSYVDLINGAYALLDRQHVNSAPDEKKMLTETSDSESDREYTLPHGQSSYKGGFSEFQPRPRPPRVPLADITPKPQVFDSTHLVDSLGFQRVHWDEYDQTYLEVRFSPKIIARESSRM